MKWKEGRRSDNVEMVQDEPRSYGDAQVTRNLATGAISAIESRELGIQCPITLKKEFLVAAIQDLRLQKNSTIPQNAVIDISGNLPSAPDTNITDTPVKTISILSLDKQVVESPECKTKVQAFRDEFEQAGLGIKMSLNSSSFDSATGALRVTPSENQFWAGKPALPGPGNK